jgi:hypothetical protein
MLKTTIRKITNLRNPGKPWSLQWQTENMPAPAFWYFATEDEAQQEERNLHTQRRSQKDLR